MGSVTYRNVLRFPCSDELLEEPKPALFEGLADLQQLVIERMQQELLWSMFPDRAPKWWLERQETLRLDAQRASEWARDYRP